jgi:hypothetical protein
LCLDQHTAENLWLLQGESLSAQLSALLGQILLRCVHAQNGLYQAKWKPQFIRELSDCYSRVIQHSRMHFLNHQFVPACGGPPWMLITLDRGSYLFEQPKLLFNLRKAQCLIFRSLLNHVVGFWAWVSGKTWCICAAQLSRSLSMQYTHHTQQQVLADCQ